MKIYFLIIFALSFKAYGQVEKQSLFSNEELKNPLKVKELDLSNESLKKLPTELIKFKNLEEIDLSENPELDLLGSFKLLSKFKRLKSLHLYNINKSIPDNISTLASIEELVLEKNQLTSIPKGVKMLPRLRKLDLWDNEISKINVHSGDLKNLEEIELGNNKMREFPDDLSLIPNLKKVSVYHNLIAVVSPSIKKLLRLEDLDMRGNYINILPLEFGELGALKKLDLRENRLSSVTPLIYLSSLEELDIADNKIEELSDKISMLKNLKKLLVSSNPLKEVPGQISKIQSLKYIGIDGNDSAKLSMYLSLVATLPELKILSITMNGIQKMPSEFEKLTQVDQFLIWDCDLTESERKRLKILFPRAIFNFHKSWGDKSFYKSTPCSMDENNWDTISVNNLKFKYLCVSQNYRGTDNNGIHYWGGEILLNLNKNLVNKETAEKIFIAIADLLQVEDIIAARTCRTFEIMHSASPPQEEEVKNYYKENYIGKYYRKTGLR
jgi:Leucine-rich repeat (LRR) protein